METLLKAYNKHKDLTVFVCFKTLQNMKFLVRRLQILPDFFQIEKYWEVRANSPFDFRAVKTKVFHELFTSFAIIEWNSEHLLLQV